MKAIDLKKLIKESISDYLTELNTEKEETPEPEIQTEFTDGVTKDGKIYLVRQPTKSMSEGGITNTFSLKDILNGEIQFTQGEKYIGAFLSGEKAVAFGKKALKARDSKLKENINVGKSKVTELESKIEDLKKQIENNSTMATHDPQRRSQLQETNDGLFVQLEKIEQGVEKLKKALEKSDLKKDKKTEDKEDLDEVTSNTSKAFSWFWGTDAKEIAKKIQNMSDKDLKNLASISWKDAGGPAKIQKQFLDREIKKRNL